jgi:hypothetical protein
MLPDKDATLEEYRSIRSEILQLNGQAFTAVTLFLGANMTILGWMLSKDDPSDYCFLPVIGVFILFCGCILLCNRDRLAHRLAIFQKYFIENKLPDIYWSRSYFLYRAEFYKNAGFFEKCSERLAISNMFVLCVSQLVNIVVFLIYALMPLFTSDPCTLDCQKVIFFVIMVIILGIQLIFKNKLAEFGNIETTMKTVASQLLNK